MMNTNSGLQEALESFKQDLPVLTRTLIQVLARAFTENPPAREAFDAFASYWRKSYDHRLSRPVLCAHLVQLLLLDRVVKAMLPGVEGYNPKVRLTERLLETCPEIGQVLSTHDPAYRTIEHELQAAGSADERQDVFNAVCAMFFLHFDLRQAVLLCRMYAPETEVEDL